MSDGLNDWTSRLQGRPLPAMSLTVQRITRLIDAPNTTHADYQQVIGRDPGFTLSIFRHFIDSGLTPREPVATLAHSIALLGLAPVTAGTRLPRLGKPAPGGGNQGIYRCYAEAAHAAWFACHWGRALGESNPEEMGIAALFQHCGELALWASEREEMRKIERHMASGLSRDNAALAVLGFTLGQLSQALAIRWGLPPLTREALQPFGAFRPRAIGVMLAAELARTTARHWQSDETLTLLELVAERQHLSLDQATAMVHRLSVELARELRGLPLPVTAFDLIPAVPPSDLPAEPTTLAETASADAKVVASKIWVSAATQPEKSDRPATANPIAVVDRCLGNWTARTLPQPATNGSSPEKQGPTPHTADGQRQEESETSSRKTSDQALQQRFTLAMQELCESTGMDRAMFAMLTPDRKKLRARFVIGADQEAAIRRFLLGVEQRHLFSLLLTKPQEFWLNSGNQEQYLPLIPTRLHATLHPCGFFVTSLFVRDRPLGILYGDCNNASTLNRQGFNRFKQLTRQLCRELEGQAAEDREQGTALAQP